MPGENFKYSHFNFAELSLEKLYDIFVLRQEVFIVEQNCPYLDADGKDIDGMHLTIETDNQLAAYARILPKGISYPKYCSIGRVVTSPHYRRQNLGIQIMKYAIEQCKLHYPGQDIKISAQCYLMDFYRKFDFKPIGNEYLEDDIPHIAMIRKQ